MAIDAIIDLPQFFEDVKFDPINLTDAFADQAGLYAHYAALSFKAAQQLSRLKVMVNMTWAKLDKEIRDRAASEGIKLTEKAIETEIERSRAYVEAKINANEAEAIDRLIRDALEAFKQRRDMLIQNGVVNRVEMEGEMRMRAASEPDRGSLAAQRYKENARADA